jgi:hypothetical protein
MLAGGLGFSLGQCVQAFHAWNLDLFRGGWLGSIAPVINWWNFMETTFGLVFGAVLALGVWLNRSRIALPREPVPVRLAPWVEVAMAVAQAGLLLSAEFLSTAPFDPVLDTAIPMAVLPILAVTAGRYWPYLLALPLVALPIAGKTLRQLGYVESQLPLAVAWVLYAVLPLILTTIAAGWFARRSDQADSARRFTRWCLLGCTWLYFGLNYAFFRFPWPWAEWTIRTPNALVFTFCACGLTWAALRYEPRRLPVASAESPASRPRR